MIDIHNHIIPNVDDGSDSLELSRQLLVDAIEEGITDVCVTPHFMKHGPYKTRKKELLSLFEELKNDVADLNINLFLGNELFIDSELDELLLNNEVCSMNDSDYVLIEFPFENYKRDYDEHLYNVSLRYRIIIAHPERYRYVRENHDFVDRWLKEGYYLQCNSIFPYSKESRKVVFDLIEKGKLSLISSDAHNENRPLSMIDAYRMVTRKFSKETAELLMDINPLCVIQNKTLKRVKPIRKRLI